MEIYRLIYGLIMVLANNPISYAQQKMASKFGIIYAEHHLKLFVEDDNKIVF